ncbi:MAG: hypothetical protein GYB64_17245, partial [Chloroflexi bacterium]|nr:hypothetical protein [Chloroflexota bacterium]
MAHKIAYAYAQQARNRTYLSAQLSLDNDRFTLEHEILKEKQTPVDVPQQAIADMQLELDGHVPPVLVFVLVALLPLLGLVGRNLVPVSATGSAALDFALLFGGGILTSIVLPLIIRVPVIRLTIPALAEREPEDRLEALEVMKDNMPDSPIMRRAYEAGSKYITENNDSSLEDVPFAQLITWFKERADPEDTVWLKGEGFRAVAKTMALYRTLERELIAHGVVPSRPTNQRPIYAGLRGLLYSTVQIGAHVLGVVIIVLAGASLLLNTIAADLLLYSLSDELEAAHNVTIGRGDIRVVAASPTGTRIAVGGSAGVHVYHAESLEMISFLTTYDPVEALAWSADEMLLAAGETSGVITLFNTERYEWHSAFYNPEELPVISLSFAPDRTQIAAVSSGAQLSLWDVESGSFTTEGEAQAVAWQADRLYLATAAGVAISADGLATAGVWESTAPGGDLRLSPDGAYLAQLGPQVTVWETATGDPLDVPAALTGNSRLVDATWLPDALVTVTAAVGVYLWEPGTDEVRTVLPELDSGDVAAVTGANADSIVVANQTDLTRLATTGEVVRTVTAHERPVVGLHWTANGLVWSHRGDGSLQLARPDATPRPLNDPQASTPPVPSPDGTRAFRCGGPGEGPQCALINLASRTLIATDAGQGVAFWLGNDRPAVIAPDGSIVLRDPQTAAPVETLFSLPDELLPQTAASDGRVIAVRGIGEDGSRFAVLDAADGSV